MKLDKCKETVNLVEAPAKPELSEREVRERDEAIYEAAVLLGEAVRRPLWGSLQGDWVERANAWNAKWDVPAVMERLGCVHEQEEAK